MKLRDLVPQIQIDTLQVEIDQMIIKGLIDENYKVLNKDILHLTEEPPVNEVHFTFDNDAEENQTCNIPFNGGSCDQC